MPDAVTFAALGDEKFLSLTTFRRSGEAVSTPVWIGRDGDALVVTTPAGSGKVKRLRNSPRIELRPCNRSGKVAQGAVSVPGTAQILDDDVSRKHTTAIIKAKYKLEYRIIMGIERVMSRSGQRGRVILRITPA